MKVAHVVVLTPKRCGLHETAREVVAGLRQRGIDSRLVDPSPSTNPIGFRGSEDRGVPVADMAWAVGADLVVSHSGYDATPIEKTAQPVIHVCHGRPRSTFIGEVMGGAPVYSYHYRLNADPRVKAVVTFWPEHKEYHEVMFPNKPVHVVQSSVDLRVWNPDGPRGYQFGGKRGAINVVCTDAWRDDVDPYVPVNAFALWARKNPGAKLHIYGNSGNLRGWGAIFNRIKEDGNLGEVKGWVGGLDNVYRAADFMVTPHVIAVRSIREAMACGCPVVKVPGVQLNGFGADFAAALKQSRSDVRAGAEKQFDPRNTAKEFHQVLETIQ